MESNKLGVSVEAIDGLKIPLQLLDRIYVNNQVEKCCDLSDALFLVFDHKVGENAITKIILPVEASVKKLGKRLVVIAPAYEESIIIGFWLKKTADEYRTSGTSTTVLTHYKSTVMGVAGASDMAILLDTHPLDGKFVDELLSKGSISVGQFNNGRLALRNYDTKQEVVIGYCDNCKLGYDQQSFFSGLHPTENLLEAQKGEVRSTIKELEDSMTVTEKATSTKLSQLRKRLARLEMKMSVIYFGADSAFDKEMLHDTIDDGVRALESARTHGVIRGSQYDLLNVVKKLYADDKNMLDTIILESIMNGIQTTLVSDLYSKSYAFRTADDIEEQRVFVSEDRNEIGPDPAEVGKRINRCRRALQDGISGVLYTECPVDIDPLNLITMQPDKNLITSAETDICAIKASIELLKILIAGNQLLMVDR